MRAGSQTFVPGTIVRESLMFGLTSNTCPGSLHNGRIEQAFTCLFETEHIARHPLGRDMSTALLIAPHRQTKSHGTAAGTRKVPDQGLPRVVSATSLSAHAENRAMVRPALPNYALRRLVVGGLATMTLIVGMLGLVGMSAGLAGSPASAASAAPLGRGRRPVGPRCPVRRHAVVDCQHVPRRCRPRPFHRCAYPDERRRGDSGRSGRLASLILCRVGSPRI